MRDVAGPVIDELQRVVTQRASSLLEQQRDRAVTTIERLGRAIEFMSDESRPDDKLVAELLAQAGKGIGRVGSYVNSVTVGSLRDDMIRAARDRPSLVFGGSLVAGFALGRFFRTSAQPPAVEAGGSAHEQVMEGRSRHGGQTPSSTTRSAQPQIERE